MLAFQACILDLGGQGDKRIGSAIALQRMVINVATAHHMNLEVKVMVAVEQDMAVASVNQRHAHGVKMHGQPLK